MRPYPHRHRRGCSSDRRASTRAPAETEFPRLRHRAVADQDAADRPRLLRPRLSTVANLVNLARSSRIPFATRLPTERRVFSVVAAVTLIRRELDQDLHLVLASGGDRMIAEAPLAPACTRKATPYRKRQMREGRKAVRAVLDGELFAAFDWMPRG